MVLEQKNKKKNSQSRQYGKKNSRGECEIHVSYEVSAAAVEKDTFRIRDKSLGRYRKSLPKGGISLYNDSDYNMKKKTIRRSEDSNTTEEGEFVHEYFECRASVPWFRRPCDF